MISNPNLSEAQRDLLAEIQQKFDTGGDVTDLRILYEVTGFKGDDPGRWASYCDYEHYLTD